MGHNVVGQHSYPRCEATVEMHMITIQYSGIKCGLTGPVEKGHKRPQGRCKMIPKHKALLGCLSYGLVTASRDRAKTDTNGVWLK